ncbi:MAG: GHKL domain-containing protein [Flavobacteriales bacterium]|nr:GHKL domain-containing protein [Flavobacteriales bacterium]
MNNLRLVILLFFCLSLNAIRGNTIEFNDHTDLVLIGGKLSIFEDPQDTFKLQSVMDQLFVPASSPVPNLGISKSAFWIKFNVENKSQYEDLLLEVSLPFIDYIEFYSRENSSFRVVRAGEIFPFQNRKYNDPNYLFDIHIPQGQNHTYYLKIKSNEGIQLPLKIGTKEAINNQIKTRDILSGIYFGIMLVMILYNLFIYTTVRDKSYIYYVVYILLILLTQTSLQGYPFQYLWPNTPIIAKYSLFIFPSLVGIASMIFMNVFLKVKEYSKRLYQVSYILTLPYIVSILFAVIKSYKLSFTIMEMNAMIVSVYMLYTGIKIIRTGYLPAKYFVAAWTVFLCGVIIYILKDFEILPFNDFTRYTMQIGSGIETVLLSFALAARINIYKKERLEAVEDKERLLKEQNIVLEEKVRERTQELNNTLQQLKDAQVQLVEAEKMSSLGQLTAGIAHEINNPINFVTSNVGPLRQDLDDLKAIISKYEELDQDNITEKLNELESLKNDLDYDYLKEELNSIINGIEDGARRTMEIVSGLRNFSRLDESELKNTDINEGIRSTLILIKNKLNGIRVETHLTDHALAECNPGKINQMMMNLIDNAIYAIQKKYDDPQEGLITIETKNLDQELQIRIADNGIGIGEEIRTKLFDPFFTTKDVGEGTGLGLSIVKGILDLHQGKIEIHSELNQGTSFIVTLPKTAA